jgi:hypothetical protein
MHALSPLIAAFDLGHFIVVACIEEIGLGTTIRGCLGSLPGGREELACIRRSGKGFGILGEQGTAFAGPLAIKSISLGCSTSLATTGKGNGL